MFEFVNVNHLQTHLLPDLSRLLASGIPTFEGLDVVIFLCSMEAVLTGCPNDSCMGLGKNATRVQQATVFHLNQ